jgi:hypothetical protein
MLPGWIISLLVLAPNLILLAFPATQTPPPAQKPKGQFDVFTGLLERIGQVGCFVLPVLYQANTRDEYTLLALEFMAATLAFYYFAWARFLRQGREFRLFYQPMGGIPLPMAVAPVLYFLTASFALRSWPVLAAAILLGIGHLAVSEREWRRCQAT